MVRRVLVIDDDAKARALVAAMLEAASYEVHSAEDGQHGLGLAAEDPPDVVLLDVHMPGMDGYEVCARLRRDPRTQALPVIMLTASDDPALNRRAYRLGAQACVPKPFRREGLVATIEAVLANVNRKASSPGEREKPLN